VTALERRKKEGEEKSWKKKRVPRPDAFLHKLHALKEIIGRKATRGECPTGLLFSRDVREGRGKEKRPEKKEGGKAVFCALPA